MKTLARLFTSHRTVQAHGHAEASRPHAAGGEASPFEELLSRATSAAGAAGTPATTSPATAGSAKHGASARAHRPPVAGAAQGAETASSVQTSEELLRTLTDQSRSAADRQTLANAVQRVVDAETIPGAAPSRAEQDPEAGTPPVTHRAASAASASPHQASPHQASPHQASPHQASPHQASPHQASPHQASSHQASLQQPSLQQPSLQQASPQPQQPLPHQPSPTASRKPVATAPAPASPARGGATSSKANHVPARQPHAEAARSKASHVPAQTDPPAVGTGAAPQPEPAAEAMAALAAASVERTDPATVPEHAHADREPSRADAHPAAEKRSAPATRTAPAPTTPTTPAHAEQPTAPIPHPALASAAIATRPLAVPPVASGEAEKGADPVHRATRRARVERSIEPEAAADAAATGKAHAPSTSTSTSTSTSATATATASASGDAPASRRATPENVSPRGRAAEAATERKPSEPAHSAEVPRRRAGEVTEGEPTPRGSSTAPSLGATAATGPAEPHAEPVRTRAVAPAPPPALPVEPGEAVISGAVTPAAAHLHVSSDTLGDVALHLRIQDGAAHVRVEGGSRAAVEARAPELARALAAEGLGLARLEHEPAGSQGQPGSSNLPTGEQPQGRHGSAEGRGSGDAQERADREARTRAAPRPLPTTPARTARTHGGKLDVTA